MDTSSNNLSGKNIKSDNLVKPMLYYIGFTFFKALYGKKRNKM